MKNIIQVLLFALIMAGCSSVPESANSGYAKPALSHYPLQHYTERLANGLFNTFSDATVAQSRLPSVVVASFLPVDTLTLEHASTEERELANQLRESMLTHARTYGLPVYEYRLRNELLLQANYEQALSRILTDIQSASVADAMLSGTYSVKEDGVIVNVRLIDIASKQVLATATDYIPVTVFWSEQQVMKRGRYLYRQNIYGDRK
ncbi:FlgO family outer membrane protein [Chromatiaceae bacterium AAb-1]|nr:FlgO family outer membrane protein [Chromatiaceae bacterium AAb-1]